MARQSADVEHSDSGVEVAPADATTVAKDFKPTEAVVDAPGEFKVTKMTHANGTEKEATTLAEFYALKFDGYRAAK